MRAYGYEYITKKSMQDKSIRINELIEELQRRYPNGSEFDSVLMLKEANPDLAGQMASLQIKKKCILRLVYSRYRIAHAKMILTNFVMNFLYSFGRNSRKVLSG